MPFDGANYELVSPTTQMLVAGRQQIQRGWCQKSMRQRGAVCMIGSLEVADYETYIETERLMLKAIGLLGHSHRSVADFNDDVHRTKEQVLEVYDTAIHLSLR